MKLAEAIMLRADMNTRLTRLRERITHNAKVQEGTQPHEQPADLLEQALSLAGELERITLRINRANLTATLDDGRTITSAIATRDRLALQHRLLLETVQGTKPETDRYSNREIRWLPTLPVADLQARAEAIARELRELNMKLQQANWQHELPE